MKKYGKSLVNAVPDEATKLLKVLCTDYRPQRLLERKWNSEHFVLSDVCTSTSTLRQPLCSGISVFNIIISFNAAFPIYFYSLTLRKLEPEKRADILRRSDWFPREMTSEEWVQKFYTVKPLQYGHQRDRTKCPVYRGVRIIEVRNVWFLAFLGPNELSVMERCP